MSGRRSAAATSAAALLAAACATDESTPSRGGRDMASRPAAAESDVRSVDAIIAAVYDAISFEPEGLPDWDRLRSLFHPDGRLVPPRGQDAAAAPALPALDVEAFVELSTGYMEEIGMRERGFHEREVARRLERFGNLAHAWSAYESRYLETDAQPFSRGINSIQLVRDGDRWWVLNIVWDVEREGNPLPADLSRGR